MAPSSGGPGSQPQQQHESRSGSKLIGGNSRSTQQWKDVPRGTMDEVSSHVRLNLSFKLTTRPRERLFYFVLESHDGCYGAAARILHSIVADVNRWSAPMQKLNDLNRSLAALEPDGTLIAVIEMSLSSWLVDGIVPGVERQPLKKLVVDESALLKLLHRWREEAEKAGRRIERIAVAFEAGRDGFWLARWLKARGIDVIHA